MLFNRFFGFSSNFSKIADRKRFYLAVSMFLFSKCLKKVSNVCENSRSIESHKC